MKTICTLIISLLVISSIATASESTKPENCLATKSTSSRSEGKNIDEDKDNDEVQTEVQSN